MYTETGNLFSLEGRVLLAERTTEGGHGKFLYVGTVPEMAIELTAEEFPYYGYDSGHRVKLGNMKGTPSGNVTGTISRLNQDNLALVLHGTVITQEIDPVVDEPLPTGLEEGGIYGLANVNVSNVVIKDSTVTPLTLPTDQYEVDAPYGGITPLDLATGGPYEEPYLASYDRAVATAIELGTTDVPERWLRFIGVNRAVVPFQKLMIDLYRVTIPMGLTDALKQEEGTYGKIPFNPIIETDPTKTDDPVLGVLGRMVLL